MKSCVSKLDRDTKLIQEELAQAKTKAEQQAAATPLYLSGQQISLIHDAINVERILSTIDPKRVRTKELQDPEKRESRRRRAGGDLTKYDLQGEPRKTKSSEPKKTKISDPEKKDSRSPRAAGDIAGDDLPGKLKNSKSSKSSQKSHSGKTHSA